MDPLGAPLEALGAEKNIVGIALGRSEEASQPDAPQRGPADSFFTTESNFLLTRFLLRKSNVSFKRVPFHSDGTGMSQYMMVHSIAVPPRRVEAVWFHGFSLRFW